jgi:predicted transcriptional regulator
LEVKKILEAEKIKEKPFDPIEGFSKESRLEKLGMARKEIVKNLDNGFSQRDENKINLLLDLIDDEMAEEYNKGMKKTREVVLSRWNGNSFNKRRSEIEVLASMLEVARGGVNKTKILYKANLSYSQLVNYLRFLMEKGLMDVVELKKGRNRYTTTTKGFLFLTAWQKTMPFLE